MPETILDAENSAMKQKKRLKALVSRTLHSSGTEVDTEQ